MQMIRMRPRALRIKGFLHGQPISKIKTQKLKDALGRHNIPLETLKEIRDELSTREMLAPKSEAALYGQPISSIKIAKLKKALERPTTTKAEIKNIKTELRKRKSISNN